MEEEAGGGEIAGTTARQSHKSNSKGKGQMSKGKSQKHGQDSTDFGSPFLTARTRVDPAKTTAEGIHNHIASLRIIANPRAEKNRPAPMGETLMG